MKYSIYALGLIVSFSALSQEGQLNLAFQRQFGPDSIRYNTPIYFSTRQMVRTKKTKPRKYNYRDSIRKKIALLNKKQLKKTS